MGSRERHVSHGEQSGGTPSGGGPGDGGNRGRQGGGWARVIGAVRFDLTPTAEAMLAVVAVMVVGALAAMGVWFSGSHALKDTIRQDMARLAVSVASEVDPELHDLIRKPEQIDSPEYAKAVAGLRRFRKSTPGIKYVYTMVRDDAGKPRFILDAADPGDQDGDGREDRSAVWEEYESEEPALFEALGLAGQPGVATASDQPYADEWGTFVSGYALILDKSGKQIGVVGVDMDAKDYLERLAGMRRVAFAGVLPALLAAFGVGLVVYRTRSRSRGLLVEANESRAAADLALRNLQVSTAEVREVYDRLHKISNQVPGALYQFRLWPDGNCAFPYASAGMKGVYGYAPEELRQDASIVFPRIHPEDVGRVRESIRESAASLTPWQAEYRVVDDDGTVRWILGSSMPQAEPDGAVLWHGFLTDISERKRSDDQLVSAQQRFEAVKRVVKMGLWEWDPKARSLQWDREMLEIFDLPASEVTGTLADAKLRVHPDDWGDTIDAFERAIRGEGSGDGSEFSSRFRIVRRDGSVTWATGHGIVIRDLAGNPIRMVGLNIDVTAQVHAEQELAAARERAEAASVRAEAASRTKSEFLANMSHEIRTPLTAILGYSDIIADTEAGHTPEETAKLARTIQSAGQHLLTVINDILDLSKVEAGRMTVERVGLCPGEVITEAVAILQPRAKAAGLALGVEFEGAMPMSIASDPIRLRQIIMNLVGNAVKFTEKGSVRVLVRSSAAGLGRARLEVDVVDTGIGLTAEESQRLFSAFSQADSSVTRKHGGTGLGLVISRRLAELLGGDVQLTRSEKGVGSCFRLAVMVEVLDSTVWQAGACKAAGGAVTGGAPTAGTSATAPTDPEKPLAGARILLAEDSIDNQRLVSFHLKRAGAVVTVAANGIEALAEFERAKLLPEAFHLILTDMHMPEMDGYTLAQTLRERGEVIPVIALTANAMSEDREKCLTSGCNDYATKPINPANLREVCAKWIAIAAASGKAA